MTLETAKLVAETLESCATTAGILAAGMWTYSLFVKKRDAVPKALVSHAITSLALTERHRLIHVSMTVQNTGSVLLSLRKAIVRVQRVLPLTQELQQDLERRGDLVATTGREVVWPQLGERGPTWRDGEAEIEPGESETIDADFVIDSSIMAVVIYSYVPNPKKSGRSIGWSRTTLYNTASREGDSDA